MTHHDSLGSRCLFQLLLPVLDPQQCVHGRQLVQVEFPHFIQQRMLGWSEQRQLEVTDGAGQVGWGDFRTSLTIDMFRLKPRKDLLCSLVDVRRNASQTRHVDPITFVRRALDDLMKEHNIVLPFLDGDI